MGAAADADADAAAAADAVAAAAADADAAADAAAVADAAVVVAANALATDPTDADFIVAADTANVAAAAANAAAAAANAAAAAVNAATASALASFVSLEQDMLVTEGTILKKGTVIGKGTNWTYSGFNGILDANFVLNIDQKIENNSVLLKYNNLPGENTQIKPGSIIAKGSQLGAKIEIGATYTSLDAIAVDSNKSIFLNADSITATEIKAGSLIKDSSTLELVALSSWTGPTLITTNGTIEKGDNVVGSIITLQGDQVLSQDLTSTLFTGANSNLKAGTILVKGSTDSSATGYEITIDSANISQNMILEKGSDLAAGSKLLTGSILGDHTYVMGGELNSVATSITTIAATNLKAGTTFKSDSVIGEGSVIDGGFKVKKDTIINSDMALGRNTLLANGTNIKAGTTLEQDIILSPTNDITGAYTSTVKAGTTLSSDMFVSYYDKSLDGVTLTTSMNLIEGSTLGKDSEVFSNTDSISLDETKTYTLKDVNVLDQEGAQRAISITEGALDQIDKIRSSLGSVQNKLSVTIANLSVTKTNIQASESVIRDVDFAEEVMIFSKMQMLGQSSSFALAQANASVQNVMSLLQ